MSAALRFHPEDIAWLREVYHEGSPFQRAAALRAVLAHFGGNE